MQAQSDSLFTEIENEALSAAAPLAVRMRPRTLNEIVGQKQAIGKGTWLRRAISEDSLSSIILYGPAGTGKTSIAHVIAHSTKAAFVEVSAVSGRVSDLRREIKAASNRLATSGQRTILFIDEIHRFSRSQQDALLHAVEDRVVILIGATTENPFFEVNTALISRSRIVELTDIGADGIRELVVRALKDKRGLNNEYSISEAALDAIVIGASGDARCALTTLELAAALVQPGQMIDTQQVQQATPYRSLSYDKDGDTHYDIISAFIKSMRGSDPDAALYWLARMIDGGEDPRFIARRIFILASEDIGLADPRALLIAHAAFKSAQVIGYPECRINLAQAAIYMALAPKSNSVYLAIDAAMREVRDGSKRQVPDPLRDRHRPGSNTYGPYLYPHNYPGGWIDQQYLPDGLSRGCFYHPSDYGWEHLRFSADASKGAAAGPAWQRTQNKEARPASQRSEGTEQNISTQDSAPQDSAPQDIATKQNPGS